MKSLMYVFCFLISVYNLNAQNVGIGTNLPSGRLQIEHRSSFFNPTLSLFDSTTTGGPIILFRNSGGARTWLIRATLNHSLANSDALDFINNGTTLARLVNSGNFGIGTTFPDEKLDVAGSIKLSGKLKHSSTGNNNLVPIAYGNISGTGVMNSGSGNFSASRTTTGTYSITITGEVYQFQTYTTVVTPVGNTAAIIVGTSSLVGNLLVYTYNASGVAVDNQFSFVVYKQ